MRKNFIKNITIYNIIFALLLFVIFIIISINNKYLYSTDEVIANAITLMAVYYLPLYFLEVIFFLWKKSKYTELYGKYWKYPLLVGPIVVLASITYLGIYLSLISILLMIMLTSHIDILGNSVIVDIIQQTVPVIVVVLFLYISFRYILRNLGVRDQF